MHKSILYALAGACAGVLITTTNALAGSGVGAVFNLGQSNSVNATSVLTGNTGAPQLRVTNTNGAFAGIRAESAGGSASAVYALHMGAAGNGASVLGVSDSTAASAFSIYGLLTAATPGALSAAVRGESTSMNSNGYGVWGSHPSVGIGVRGDSQSGIGVWGTSQTGTGVTAGHYGPTGTRPGLSAFTWSTDAGANAVYGQVLSTSAGPNSAAVEGKNLFTPPDGAGADRYGVQGIGPTGVYGTSTTDAGNGVTGVAKASALYGSGVVGQASGQLQTGVLGSSTATNGVGVSGEANNGAGAHGVEGTSSKGIGVYGDGQVGVKGLAGFGNEIGVWGANTYGTGVSGTSSFGTGVSGTSSNRPGVSGTSQTSVGVSGSSSSGHGVDGWGQTGVHGSSSTLYGYGVVGEANVGSQAIGVWGKSTNGYAGFFSGKVRVVGNLEVTGTVTKGGGAFRIDHPLDPKHTYLQHSFVESPDMMDVYNGNVETDANGFATVTMPRWFQALNRSFRYQLTIVGTRGWNARVVKEISHNQFTIQTDLPRVKVSWQVTGIRHDRYANAHRIQVELPKPPREPT